MLCVLSVTYTFDAKCTVLLTAQYVITTRNLHMLQILHMTFTVYTRMQDEVFFSLNLVLKYVRS